MVAAHQTVRGRVRRCQSKTSPAQITYPLNSAEISWMAAIPPNRVQVAAANSVRNQRGRVWPNNLR